MKHTSSFPSSFLFPALAALAIIAPAAHAQTASTVTLSAVTLSGGVVDNATDNGVTSFVLGYTFTLSAPVAVTALGFYDDNNTELDFNGNPTPGSAMAQTHQVGIFSDATGLLLVRATVSPTDTARAAFNGQTPTAAQAKTDGTGVQLFRYDSSLKDGATGLVSLPVFVLTPGLTYTIAAVTGTDNYDYLPGSVFAGGTFGTGSVVSYGQDRYVNGSASILTDPTSTSNNDFGSDGSGGEITGPAYFGPNFLFAPAAAPEPSTWVAFAVGLLSLGVLTLKARKRQHSA